MDDPDDREAGWPIGSGMIESTGKPLVGLRLKGPGRHWTEAGALAVTALRATDLNATDLNATDLNATDLNATDLNDD